MTCSKERTALALLMYCALLHTVSSISCYQCSGTNSSNPFECTEFLDSDTDLVSMSCDHLDNAQYCIKHVGRYEGGISTKRYCSSVNLGNTCGYVQQPGDKLERWTCVYTCTADGCNSGRVIPASVLHAAIASVAALLRLV